MGVIGVRARAGLFNRPTAGTSRDCRRRRLLCPALRSGGRGEAKGLLAHFPGLYRKLLEQKDVDGVIVATTEHGRVLPCIHTCQAGKDVYAQKPLTICIGKGRTLVKAVTSTSVFFRSAASSAPWP